jgi:hypothetical protein
VNEPLVIFLFRHKTLQLFLLLKDLLPERPLEEARQDPREEAERRQAEVHMGRDTETKTRKEEESSRNATISER